MIGSIVLATDQGLGYLAKDFYDNGIVNLVSIHRHSVRQNHYEWYPNHVSKEELLEKCDTLLFFETVFDWTLFLKAREKGIKTIIMVMYECSRLPYLPDEIWSPSLLDQQYYPGSKLVQVPVNVPWKLRKKAKVFVHNAGNGGLGGRNGTKELLEAMEYVKSPIKLIVRSQVDIPIPKYIYDLKKDIEIRIGTFDDVWSEGDVFVFPEKFNGLSLPIQEAFASGMLVMASKRFPNTEYLPNEPLIPVDGYHTESIAVEFECAELSPETIAAHIDEWYNKDIEEYSLLGKEYNERNSWKEQSKILQSLLSEGQGSSEAIS